MRTKLIQKIKRLIEGLLPPKIRLFIKMVAITMVFTILPVVWALYRIRAGDIFGFFIGWFAAWVIMVLTLFFVAKPRFKAYIESLAKHEESGI